MESARIEDGETSVTAIDDAEDDAPDVELPPPMKPIQASAPIKVSYNFYTFNYKSILQIRLRLTLHVFFIIYKSMWYLWVQLSLGKYLK